MKRVLIVGCGGSGKTTLAKAMAGALGLPLVHLDTLYWTEEWRHVSKDVFAQRLMSELEKDEWIIDGNFRSTLELRLEYCDTAIFLDYPTLTCLFGVLRRVTLNYGSCRSDMGGKCPEKFDPQFIKWVWDFRRDKRAALLQALNDADGTEIIILKNRREAKRFLSGLQS